MKPRKEPMRRSGIKRKPTRRREAAAMQDAFMSEHLRCSVCHISSFKAYGPDRRIVLHHLAGRGAGTDTADSWLAICNRCHEHHHQGGRFDDITGARLPELTAGMLLGCKAESDGLDEALIASLKNWRALPAHWTPVELPAVFYLERERNA